MRFNPWRTALSLLNPVQNLLLVHGFFCQYVDIMRAYKPSGGSMHTAVIHCPCGHVWTYARPDRYSGRGHYPQRCPACDGAGELVTSVNEALEKISNS